MAYNFDHLIFHERRRICRMVCPKQGDEHKRRKRA